MLINLHLLEWLTVLVSISSMGVSAQTSCGHGSLTPSNCCSCEPNWRGAKGGMYCGNQLILGFDATNVNQCNVHCTWNATNQNSDCAKPDPGGYCSSCL